MDCICPCHTGFEDRPETKAKLEAACNCETVTRALRSIGWPPEDGPIARNVETGCPTPQDDPAEEEACRYPDEACSACEQGTDPDAAPLADAVCSCDNLDDQCCGGGCGGTDGLGRCCR